jgi:hypothetical protein
MQISSFLKNYRRNLHTKEDRENGRNLAIYGQKTPAQRQNTMSSQECDS